MCKSVSVELSLGLILLMAAAGCTQYVISSQLREQAVNAPSFAAVLENPDKFIGQTVIWGGIIIDTTNEPGYTLIKVLQTPLSSDQLPTKAEYSQGRFIVRASGYLDGEVYQKGRKITVAGSVTGKEILPVSSIQYTYPVIALEEVYLWQQPAPAYYDPYYYRPFFWGWGWYGSCLSYPWRWGPTCMP